MPPVVRLQSLDREQGAGGAPATVPPSASLLLKTFIANHTKPDRDSRFSGVSEPSAAVREASSAAAAVVHKEEPDDLRGVKHLNPAWGQDEEEGEESEDKKAA